MSIIENQYKKTFSIVLNVWDLTSWTGIQFNATFPVDLTKILDPEDFAKTYEMRFTFRSRRSNNANQADPATSVYHLAIDFQKGLTSQSYTQQYNIVGIVPVSTDTTAYTSTTCTNYFDAKPQDNEPVLVRDLQGVNSIRLTLLVGGTNTIFTPGLPDRTRYVCILNFKEL